MLNLDVSPWMNQRCSLDSKWIFPSMFASGPSKVNTPLLMFLPKRLGAEKALTTKGWMEDDRLEMLRLAWPSSQCTFEP